MYLNFKTTKKELNQIRLTVTLDVFKFFFHLHLIVLQGLTVTLDVFKCKFDR